MLEILGILGCLCCVRAPWRFITSEMASCFQDVDMTDFVVVVEDACWESVFEDGGLDGRFGGLKRSVVGRNGRCGCGGKYLRKLLGGKRWLRMEWSRVGL